MEASVLASKVSRVRDYLWNTIDALQEANKWLDKMDEELSGLSGLYAKLLGIAREED